MTIEIVQTLIDGTPHYRQSTPLEGTLYIIYLDWNSRDGRWYLSIHDAEDIPIYGLVGLRLVQNWFPTRLSTAQNRPPGQFLVISTGATDPGLEDLGAGTSLMYVPAADFAELTA